VAAVSREHTDGKQNAENGDEQPEQYVLP